MGQISERRAIAEAALTIALGYSAAGIHEEGGNNRGDQVEFFQRLMGGAPGDPWCADFVSTCLVKGYARHHDMPEDREHLPGYVAKADDVLFVLSGYCPALASGARARGLFHSRDFAPSPGDLVLFDFTRSGAPPHHVGMATAVSFPPGVIHTVEGNTGPGAAGSQRDGDGVYLRVRSRADVYGFVHWG